MRLRFGLEDDEPRTLQEIGDRLHLSRERVRQIESRAKDKAAPLGQAAQSSELRPSREPALTARSSGHALSAL